MDFEGACIDDFWKIPISEDKKIFGLIQGKIKYVSNKRIWTHDKRVWNIRGDFAVWILQFTKVLCA